jgi:polyisoprenoid-binding protein YceI
MVAAEWSAVTGCRPGRLRAILGLPKDDEGKGNAPPRRIAGRPHVTRMRATLTFALLLIVGLANTSQAVQRRIQFGPPASEVAFRAYGLGMLPIDSKFAQFAGSLTYDPDDLASCRVELQVQVASLVTEDSSLRSTIIGPEFMDAASFPALSYEGTCAAKGLGGDLAMHGVTRPFELSLTWSRDRVVAEGRLVRADWGMTAMSVLGGRTVRISVAVPLRGTSQNAEK